MTQRDEELTHLALQLRDEAESVRAGGADISARALEVAAREDSCHEMQVRMNRHTVVFISSHNVTHMQK